MKHCDQVDRDNKKAEDNGLALHDKADKRSQRHIPSLARVIHPIEAASGPQDLQPVSFWICQGSRSDQERKFKSSDVIYRLFVVVVCYLLAAIVLHARDGEYLPTQQSKYTDAVCIAPGQQRDAMVRQKAIFRNPSRNGSERIATLRDLSLSQTRQSTACLHPMLTIREQTNSKPIHSLTSILLFTMRTEARGFKCSQVEPFTFEISEL